MSKSYAAAKVPVAWMFYSLLLSGLGTALLGPILPLLAKQWHLQDAQSGLLMTAKFCGAFCGGVLVQQKLERSLLLGMMAAMAGFGWFAVAPSMAIGCAGLFLGGFGLGQLITATNILAGRRFTTHRGSALALLNFSFSIGAMLSAFLATGLIRHYSLRTLLAGFAVAFGAGALSLLVLAGRSSEELEHKAEPAGKPGMRGGLVTRVGLYFLLMLFLYGGLETCLNGWLTTFALRYGGRTLLFSEYATLLFWLALTAGRAISSLLLLRFQDATVQRAALGLSMALTALLGLTHSAAAIGVLSILLGLALAPIFPATFSLVMARHPSASQAGLIMAVSGLGAAALPWVMGVVSTGTGSLKMSVWVPVLSAGAMLLLSVRSLDRDNDEEPAFIL